MRRLNVKAKHIKACIDNNKFAVNMNLKLLPGEILLLQLVKQDIVAKQRRVRAYMVFDRIYPDPGGESDKIWGTYFKYIIDGKINTLNSPFNIEDIVGIGDKYNGQAQGMIIKPEDEHLVKQHLN